MTSVVNFAVNSAPGGYLATWTNDPSLNATNVSSLSLIYTTTEPNDSYKLININPITKINTTTGVVSVVNEYLLTSLPVGYTYQMSLQTTSTSSNLTLSGSSNTASFSVVSAPTKPVFKVTAGDQLLFFALLNASGTSITSADRNTIFDGFDDLTKIDVSLSDKTAGYGKNITLLAYDASYNNDPSYNFYTDGGFILDTSNFTNMQNNHTYAVALTYYNENGKSVLSDTLFFTPSQLPIDMDVAAVESIYVNRTTTGGTIFWNPPKNGLSGIQSVANVKSYAVWRAIVDASGAGVATKLATDFMLDVSGNNSSIQAVDVCGNYIYSTFDSISYKHKYVDTTSTNGIKYRYYITATNQYGSSTIKDSSSYADVIVGGIPLAPVITSTPGDQKLKLFVNTTDKLNGLKSSGKVYVKLYAASQISLTDASRNALHGYNWTEMTLDPSSCVTLVDLINGKYYGASVKIETQSNVFVQAMYVSPEGKIASGSAPYKVPSVPTGLFISPVDASSNPLDGKLTLSWNAQTYLAVNGFGPDASVNFVVWRNEGRDASGNKINAVIFQANTATTYQDTNLTNDKIYYYQLEAKVMNSELQAYVDSAESTPPVAAAPFRTPNPVTSLVADCSGNGDIYVNWVNITDASANYKLVLNKIENNLLTLSVTLYPTASGVILANSVYKFTMGTAYTIAVSSVIIRNEIQYSSNATNTTGTPYVTPGVIQDLQLSVSSGQILSLWEKPLNMDLSGVVTGVTITSYYVALKDAFGIDISGGSFNSSLSNVNYNSSLYKLIMGLTNGISYKIAVTARGNVGSKQVNGTEFISSSVKVQAGPASAQLLTSDASDKTIKLNWIHDNESINIFKILQNDVLLNNPNPTIVNEGVYNSNGIIGYKWSATITGLTNGTSYKFEVIASSGTSDAPTGVASSIVTNATPYKAPSAPMPAAQPFAVDTTKVTLNWSVPTDNGGFELLYKVELFDTSNNTLSDASGILMSGYPAMGINELTKLCTSLVNGRFYFAKVYAYYQIPGSNPVVNSTSAPLRIPASSSMKVNAAPPNVTNLVATPGNKSVKLTWTDPSNVANYTYTTTIVQRFDLASGIYVQVASLKKIGTYIDNNLINGVTYSYKVIAEHSNTYAQQPSGVIVTNKPVGAPAFEVSNTYNNVDVSGNLDFKLKYNRNGADVTSATLIGIDFNGIARVKNVTTEELGNKRPLLSAVFNDVPCLPSETFEWTLPRIDGDNKIHDLLIIMTNSAGSTVVSWPIPPNAFENI